MSDEKRDDYPVAAMRLRWIDGRVMRAIAMRTMSDEQMEKWITRTHGKRVRSRRVMWIEEEWRPAVLVGMPRERWRGWEQG